MTIFVTMEPSNSCTPVCPPPEVWHTYWIVYLERKFVCKKYCKKNVTNCSTFNQNKGDENEENEQETHAFNFVTNDDDCIYS